MNYVIVDVMKSVKSIIRVAAVIIMSLALVSSSSGADAETWRCSGVVNEIQFVCFGASSSICTTMTAPNRYVVCNGTKMVLIPMEKHNKRDKAVE